MQQEDRAFRTVSFRCPSPTKHDSAEIYRPTSPLHLLPVNRQPGPRLRTFYWKEIVEHGSELLSTFVQRKAVEWLGLSELHWRKPAEM